MLFNWLYILWIIFQICVAIILLFPLFSYIVYLFTKKKPVTNIETKQNDYAVIITAFKNSSNLNNVIDSLLKLNHNNYIIYVVADGCPDYYDTYNNEKVVIIKPEILLSNQVTSHFLAIQNFKRQHNLLTIIDSDNLVTPGYLTGLDSFFNMGYEAVQGVRKAKNLDTPYACLDAMNELYYLFYDRKILFAIGSSSMLSGSGMAFTVKLFKECMEKGNSTGAGFDKILQKEIVRKGYRIAFAEDAIILDEKTARPDQLIKQRARWNNTWFRYYKFGIYLMGQGIRKAKINRFLFGFILTRPPLFILLIFSFIIMLINLFFDVNAAITWAFMLLLFLTGFFLALKKSDTDERIYKSIVHVPKFIVLQIFSLFKAKKANEYSVATEHSYNKEIDKI
ncbi:MAG: glycosyltransferase [Ferruginibacter sp.]